jgi:hypothetical protein
MQKLSLCDEGFQRAAFRSATFSNQFCDDENSDRNRLDKIFNWRTLDLGNQLAVHVVLEDSDAPTQLVFTTTGASEVAEGHGHAFWQEQVGGTPLQDFSCRARVGFDYVEVDAEAHTMKVVLKVHSLMMTLPPKVRITKCTASEIQDFVRASKRIRLHRL